jgi:rhamnosyltransferase
LNKPKPGISVVIPVKNESKRLADCLNGILRQTVEVDEIIVIDSGSDDGTQAIATSFPKVKLIEIQPSEFNHGDTRNLGVRHASGKYVLFTVGDAWAVDEFWTERLMAGFVDESVAGVCGSQVVAHLKDTNPVEWFRPQTEPKLKLFSCKDADEFDAKTPDEKRKACSWDDVNAIYRKSALQEVPFQRTVYGEDVFWAIETMRLGKTLAYQPGARVYHFHLDNYATTLKRTISVCYLRNKVFGSEPGSVNVWTGLAKCFYRLMKEKNLTVREKIYWIKYNANLIRAVNTGLRKVDDAIAAGPAEVDALHQVYCGSPPIPLKAFN